jgi:hypothetical protein
MKFELERKEGVEGRRLTNKLFIANHSQYALIKLNIRPGVGSNTIYSVLLTPEEVDDLVVVLLYHKKLVEDEARGNV